MICRINAMKKSLLASCLGALAALSVGTLSCPAHADGASLTEATDVQKQAAQIRYLQGMEDFKAGKYEAARKGFDDSFETVASPNSLLMVVRSLVEMKRNVEAYEQAQKTARVADEAAKKSPKYTQTAEAARGVAETLRAELGFVSVLGVDGAPEGTKLTVAGRDIPRDAWGTPIPVAPGEVVVAIDGRALPPTSVAAGSTQTIDASKVVSPVLAQPGDDDDDDTVRVTRSGTYRGPDRLMMAAIAGGVGAAGFITVAVFGTLAESKFADLETACPGRNCPDPALEDDADAGSAFQAVANTGLVFGILGTVAAGGLIAWDFIDPPAPDQQDDDTARYRPKLLVGPGNIMLRGSI